MENNLIGSCRNTTAKLKTRKEENNSHKEYGRAASAFGVALSMLLKGAHNYFLNLDTICITAIKTMAADTINNSKWGM